MHLMIKKVLELPTINDLKGMDNTRGMLEYTAQI